MSPVGSADEPDHRTRTEDRERDIVNEIRTQLDERSNRIQEDLLAMIQMVTERVGTVTSALLEGDVARADELITADDEIDLISLRVEQACNETLVREQPVATDLRFVVAAMHMNSDIERSGGLVANIAKAVGRLQGSQIDDRVRSLIAQMASQAQLLFRRAGQALETRDLELAQSIDELDDVLDDLHRVYIQTVIHEARRGDLDPQQSLQLALVGRFYERIGDHAENLGERIRYMVTGWLPQVQAAERARARGEPGDDAPNVGSRGMAVIDAIAEERRVDAIRQDFVANVSHELKTPVGAMSLLADALMTADDADRERLVGLLQKESKRAEDIIDDLLELARLDEPSATFSSVSVDDVVTTCVEAASSLSAAKSIQLAVSGVPSGSTVMGNRRELERAVVNLLDNAVRYAAPGTTVTIRVESLPNAVDVSVRDTGEGIPRPELERIFERFYRVDSARSRETGGTGLGLAIVRHVASNHAGRIFVESKQGEGSIFTLHLPTVAR